MVIQTFCCRSRRRLRKRLNVSHLTDSCPNESTGATDEETNTTAVSTSINFQSSSAGDHHLSRSLNFLQSLLNKSYGRIKSTDCNHHVQELSPKSYLQQIRDRFFADKYIKTLELQSHLFDNYQQQLSPQGTPVVLQTPFSTEVETLYSDATTLTYPFCDGESSDDMEGSAMDQNNLSDPLGGVRSNIKVTKRKKRRPRDESSTADSAHRSPVAGRRTRRSTRLNGPVDNQQEDSVLEPAAQRAEPALPQVREGEGSCTGTAVRLFVF